MGLFRIILLVFQASVVSRLACGASIDRYESAEPGQTTVIDLRRSQSESVAEGIAEYIHYDEEGDYYGDEEQEYEDYASGVEEVYVPKVAHSSKPKDPTVVLEAARNNVTKSRGLGRKRGKGKGKKRDPCLRKYKSFCIHGTCRYHKELRTPTCVCNAGYIGERCHTLTLPVGTNPGNYDRTTALAVMAVVLSSLCLTIIAILLAIKYHKRGAYNVENEEKVKLGTAPHH